MRNYIIYIMLSCFLATSGCSKSGTDLNNSTTGNSQTGQGGSLARYTIVGKYLYTVDANKLRVFDLDATNGPTLINELQIGFDIETIFPFKDYLFIGSNSEMFIFSITTPTQPQALSSTIHFNGCDPVVANDTHAFLTIRSGNACRSMINELQVYDINDIQQPIWLKSIAMSHPIGLALNNQYLYVCDQEKGLYVMDITQAQNPVLKNTLTGEVFLDVIADTSTQTLIAMLTDGIALYDMSDPIQLTKLSVIK